MTRIEARTFTLLAALFTIVALPAMARDGALIPPAIATRQVSVEVMPPVMRAAYLAGIREELVIHGYDPGPDDGAFGNRFSAAIRRYQSDAGLRPDAVASKELLEHLLFALPKIYADGSRGVPAQPTAPDITRIALVPPTGTLRHQTEEPVPSPAPRGRVSVKPLPNADPSAKTGFPHLNRHQNIGTTWRSAKYGSGGFVSRTQRTLRERGYYDGPIDGRFDDKLADAIRAFQKSNRLPITGVIDSPLLEALS